VLRKRLVGTWTQQSKPNLTNTATVALALHADGTYSEGVTSVVGGATSSSYPTGDWAIQNGVYLRRLHNFALDMTWLPRPVIVKRQWPKVQFNDKRAITCAVHQAIVAGEQKPLESECAAATPEGGGATQPPRQKLRGVGDLPTVGRRFGHIAVVGLQQGNHLPHRQSRPLDVGLPPGGGVAKVDEAKFGPAQAFADQFGADLAGGSAQAPRHLAETRRFLRGKSKVKQFIFASFN
jgi:hypothetical protein